jgi:hypothetical protein
MFSSFFASVYLFFEIAFKFVASACKSLGPGGTNTMYAIFVAIGILSSIGMSMVGEAPAQARNSDAVETKAARLGLAAISPGATFELLTRDGRMALMIPTQVSFGFMVAFLNSYISSEIVTKGEQRWHKYIIVLV